jgi:hypothetical protein
VFSIFLLLAFESEMYIKVNTKMNSLERDTIGISVMDLCALSNASACFSLSVSFLSALSRAGVHAHLYFYIFALGRFHGKRGFSEKCQRRECVCLFRNV